MEVMNKTAQWICYCLLLLMAAAAHAGRDRLPALLTLYEGQSRVLTAVSVERVAVGRSEILGTAILQTDELVLTAEKIGKTSMNVWFSDGRFETISIEVVSSLNQRELHEIRELIGDIPGISIRAVGHRIFVEGDLEARDLARVERLKELYPTMMVLAQERSAFTRSMIYFNVQITEFNISDLEDLGIDWSTSIEGPNLRLTKAWNHNELFRGSSATDPLAGNFGKVQGTGLAYWGIATEITSRINYLVSTGAALSLASPRLSARSGGDAQFVAGGEVPVVTSSITGQTVNYKQFGILLSLQPEVDPYGNIIARVSTEVSSVDRSTQVGEFPGFKTRRTEADVGMQEGETLVLAGLINRDFSEASDGVKWLRDIPVLGELFQSKSFQAGRTELVVFVTPEVVDLGKRDNINQKELNRAESLIDRFEERTELRIID